MKPDTNSSERRVVPASEILAKIERSEPVEYDGVIIEGDLDISGLDLPTEQIERTAFQLKLGAASGLKMISSEITITDSEIQGKVNFSNAQIQNKISFAGTQFVGRAVFLGVRFSKCSHFDGARFGSYTSFVASVFDVHAFFEETQFDNSFTFEGAQFDDYAGFGGTRSSSNADFRWAWFKGNTHFEDAKFGDAKFEEARFCGARTDFTGAVFEKKAEFEGVHFSGRTSFETAIFHEYVSFSHSYFRKGKKDNRNSTDFEYVKFNEDADFVDIRFETNNCVSFKSSVFKGDANFAGMTVFFEDADFRDVKFKGDVTFYNTEFYKKLLLGGSDFNRLRARSWDSIKDELDCNGPVYLQLVKSFKLQELFEDADNCYYDYREWRRKTKYILRDGGSNWPKLYEFVSYLSCGYGVRPGYTLGWILVAMYIFWVIFLGCSESIFDAIYFSFTSLTGSYPSNLPIGDWKYAVMFENLTGYLFLALFVVVLTRKLIR